MRKYMLGVGTGRCGTMSLARLINGCRDCMVYHELGRPECNLPWKFDEVLALETIDRLRKLPGLLVGDVALYYLNYLEFFLRRLPNLKIVHIHREKALVVESFMTRTLGRNHWMTSDPEAEKDERWDSCFPKFEKATSKEEAISRYYNDYLERVTEITSKYPSVTLDIDVQRLNRDNQQRLLFDFLEIPEANRVHQTVHSNQTRRKRPAKRDTELLEALGRELKRAVPSAGNLILIDRERLQPFLCWAKKPLPFLEHNGEYWGKPPNDEIAISEVKRMRRKGATFIAFGWPSFWWFDYYPDLAEYLQANFVRTLQNDRLIVFDLGESCA